MNSVIVDGEGASKEPGSFFQGLGDHQSGELHRDSTEAKAERMIAEEPKWFRTNEPALG